MITVINIFLLLLAAYVIIGLLFAVYFFFKGAAKIDPLINDSSWKVRLLLIPGAIATWIFLLPKLMKNKNA